ncbi:MAG: hypothetical protein CMI16_14575 [Opitutaceae bacterium]|nr:hypothetical protein [Opitutaceae bacterium]|tara:strand:- start:1852 stop:2322 length:471 start_codon:yes stop_codon:yes gene_type:complete
MATDNITVSVKGVMPTTNGCAVFLGDEGKSFLIYVDHPVGSAIQMSLAGTRKSRPLTHDLIDNILLGLEAKLDHVVINESKGDTYFARIVLKMSNELGTKIVEIDARPSDSIVLALHHEKPIHVSRSVYDQEEDKTDILERVLRQQSDDTDQTDES